ncbi:MAG TPA: hypothetical protein VF426_02100 [Marmoricola sp.]
MDQPMRSAATTIGRRRLLAGGAGAAALTADAVLTAGSAAASPQVPVPPGSDVKKGLATADDTSTDDLVDGLVYRTASMYDFFPFAATGQRQWGGEGVYSSNTAGAMRATVIPPPGATLTDVQFWVYNNSGSAASGDVLRFTPGAGTMTNVGSVSIPSTGTISVARAVISATTSGPYPVGTVLMASVTTPLDGTVQVNAARFGFASGAGTIGLLASPVRVYDSRQTTKLAKFETRTITLPAANVAPGTTGVLLNMTAMTPAGAGALKVWSAAVTGPSTTTLNFANGSIANAFIAGISASRQIKVHTTQAVHITIDLTGTVS